MKAKRFLALLLAFAMCFVFASCKNNADDEDIPPTTNIEQTTENSDISQSETSSPILYRVTDKNGNIIWLFGSIHIGREDYYPLPDYVQNAFDKSDILAVEADIVAFEKNSQQQTQALSHLIYRDGTSIKDHIPQELYDEAVQILKKYDSYVPAMDWYCPAFWSSIIDSLMIEQLGGNSELGIDQHLLEKAYETEKEIVEIESIEFQYSMLGDFDDEIQLMLLKSSVEMCEDIDTAAADLEEMMDLWASGDEKAFTAYLNDDDETMTDEEIEIYERYDQIMVTNRNLHMADYAEYALSSGKEVFICVGAAHILGDGAIADLLSQRGYKVERISR